MLAMLGMAGAAVASAAGLMTTDRKYPCSVGLPVYCLIVIRFSFVLLARTCNAVIVFAASVLLVGVQHASVYTVHDSHYESAALPRTLLCVCVMGRGDGGLPTIHMRVRVCMILGILRGLFVCASTRMVACLSVACLV